MGEPCPPRRCRLLVVALTLFAAACTSDSGRSSSGAAHTDPASSTASSTEPAAPEPTDSLPAGQESTVAPPETAPTLGADEAHAVLLAASFADLATLDHVEALKGEPAMVSAASEVIGAAPAGALRWAAVYVLANATDTAAALVPFLTDPDVTIRVLASIGAIGQGERAGFPVLIEALSHDELLSGFEPPARAWATASLALARHTGLVLGPALDADAADRDASIRRWQDWWTQHGSTVQFDVATEEWAP